AVEPLLPVEAQEDEPTRQEAQQMDAEDAPAHRVLAHGTEPQMVPCSMAWRIQGITSSSISSSVVVASKPSTSRAFSTAGTRRCTSRVNGPSWHTPLWL